MWIRLEPGLRLDPVLEQIPKRGATAGPCCNGLARGRLMDFLNWRMTEEMRSMRNNKMNSASRLASNVSKCLVQLALPLVPALDLMI